jgi:hypothetical protein
VLEHLPCILGLPSLIFICLDLKSSNYLEGFFDTGVGVQCEVCCQLLGLLLDFYRSSMDNFIVWWDTCLNS